jgi:hypothetical protein
MNFKWVKNHVTTVVAVTLYVVVLGLIIWQQQRASTRTEELAGELDSQQMQLQSILASRPFPSQENVQSLQQSREQLDQQYTQLHGAVCVSSLNVPEVTRPIEFFQLLAQRIGLMRVRTRQANIKVPEAFAFGFTRYENAPPGNEDTQVLAQLTKQLVVVEKLVDTLAKSGIEEIVAVRRTEVDPGTSPDALLVPVTADPKALYQILPFEFEFICTTQTLRAFLNSLAKLDCFFAVRSLTITSADALATGTTASEDPTRPAPKIVDDGTARSRLKATIRIDLVEFTPAEAKAGATR